MEARTPPKLIKARRLDSIRLDQNDRTYFTEEGYLVDHPILTSCGIFVYANPDGSTRRELRLPEHVFDKESLESYKGKPVIITHDAGYVNKKNVDSEQIGTIPSDGYQDDEDVRAEIIIHDTDSMKSCGLKELSLGYSLDLIEEPGTWKGQHYDAIQTNIRVNHLALVGTARAGEQARLNIDGSTEPTLKGGKAMAKNFNADGGAMSPDELKKAIEDYKARRAERKGPETVEEAPEEPVTDEDDTDLPENENRDGVETHKAPEDGGKTPEDIVAQVKKNRENMDSEDDPKDVDGAMGLVARKDADIDMLLACIEKLLGDRNDGDEPVNNDGDGCGDGEDKKMNADSADIDKIVQARLSICRVGDKLRLDGLESKSIPEAKKAIIGKVFPNIRLDGKSAAYIDAMYDLAVGEANKRKTVADQRKQMATGARRADAADNMPTAAEARRKMIEREGGNN